MDEPQKFDRFYFQAVNPEGQKISGSFFAESLEDARDRLRKQGMAILSLEVYSAAHDENTGGNFQKFEFEGEDSNKKIVRGKIEAVDKFAAYKKLREEYQFDLKALFPENISESEKQAQREQGIPADFVEKFQEEAKKQGSSFFGNKKKTDKKTKKEKAVLSKKEQEQLLFLQDKIGDLISEVSRLLTDHRDILDSENRREIEERLNLLSRLRRSNALDHLKSLTKKVIEELEDDTLFLNQKNLTADQSAEIEEQKDAFRLSSGALGTKFRNGLASVTIDFSAIDPNLFLDKFKKVDPVGTLGEVFYWAVVSVFGLFTVFWMVNSVQLWNSAQVSKILFYVHSPVLWWLTGLSALLSILFFPAVFSIGKMTWKKRLIFFCVALLAVGVFIFEAPALFSWTR
ncbi:hypothetical protein HOA64_02090 [bacterium]|jgi:hypothetical protein|nr:hypothetical protein [bacterium]MBT7772487.1 hypothetical protein [bacterium]